YPVVTPNGFDRAVQQGTRSLTGAPGPSYWQQWTDYTIRSRLDVEAKRVEGTVRMVYHNNSPRPLPVLALQLIQNVHREGAVRNREAEVTGGMEITRLVAGGDTLAELTGPQRPTGTTGGYAMFGTAMMIRPPRAIPSRDSIVLEVDYGFRIPEGGAGSRMGYNGDNLVYLAYWYPQMAVYDDVVGWQTDPFLGNAEFYMGYGNYEVTLEVPQGWTVIGTGTLTNANDVLPQPILDRLRRAEQSDTVVHVLTPEDFGAGKATRTSSTGYLAWTFTADSVRDVAYSVSRESRWDAARTRVGDRNGDGTPDYARVDAIWRETAPLWVDAWRYSQHSIDFLSRWTGFPYPYAHMTSVEGGGIMGGGMEYPMMTLIGDYTGAPDTALYSVHAHEEAHMWVPMIVGNDERRTAWMDEGTTSFNTSAAEDEFYPGRRWELENYDGYLSITRTDLEGPIMTWSDFHTNGMAYGIASYAKPATALWTLHGLLGEELFLKAYRTFIRRWAYKHPKPWDLFNTFNDVTGQDLDWYWRTWYYETWTLDQAVKEVRLVDGGTKIVIEDLGLAPMPVRLTLTKADGATVKAEIPVDIWLTGVKTAETVVKTDSPVVKVEIDAEQVFPDANRGNNVWERK
ncbi:MAG: M1 family metallopeptidase, partial [Gemmatimonadales bacterium]|nr:M1 family metallopeptidase [Gemmatimonadales bacterium]